MNRVEPRAVQEGSGRTRPADPTHSGSDRSLLALLLAAVVLAPLPLGSTRPEAWIGLSLLIGLLLLAWAALVLARRADMAVALKPLLPVMLPLLLALLWSALQGSGLLPVWMHHPLWEESRAALGLEGTGSLSLDPQATADAVLRNAAYLGIFFLAVQLGRNPAHASTALSTLAIAGSAYAVYGLLAHLSGSEMILWMPKWAYLGDLTATFVNRNAYGAYAAIGLLCCLARLTQTIASLHSGRSFRLRDLADRLAVRAVPLVVAVFLLMTCILLTHSRGAMVSSLFGLGALLACLVVARLMSRRKAALLVLVAVPVVLGLVVFSGEKTLDRLSVMADNTAMTDEVRNPAFRLELDAVAQAPWTGYGLGTFLSAFRQFRDISLAGPVTWDYAHNVHLELLMDLGIPGAVLVYAGFGAMAVLWVQGMRQRRRHQIYPALALACLSMAALHGAMDFSPQIPAVAATLALIAGIGVAQSWPQGSGRRRRGSRSPAGAGADRGVRDGLPEESADPSP